MDTALTGSHLRDEDMEKCLAQIEIKYVRSENTMSPANAVFQVMTWLYVDDVRA